MFVSDEMRIPVSAAAAATRLAALTAGGSLAGLSHAAWGDGIGRVGAVPGISELVLVQFREPVRRGPVTVLTLRWQAADTRGALFPVLDADITLSSDGDHATLIGLDGVYRPPARTGGPTPHEAAPHEAALQRAATATIRSLLNQIADAITRPAPPAGTPAPARGRNV